MIATKVSAKKKNDNEEEMKGSQLKNNVKIEEVNVVTHANDSLGNEVLFVSWCFNAHALLANMDGDMHTWILNSSDSFHITLIVSGFWTKEVVYMVIPPWGELCMWH